MTIDSRKFFTDDEKKQIDAAVVKAEANTSGEIVPVIATRSGPYDRGLFYAALMIVFLATLTLVAFHLLPIDSLMFHFWEIPLWLLLPVQSVALFGGFYAAAKFPGLHRAFVPHAMMGQRVDHAARSAFHSFKLTHTEASTGIMLYVSLFERAVVVVADKSINEKHEQQEWDKVRDLLTDGLRDGDAAGGFENAIAECGRVLSAHFPIQEGDVNELPNHLRMV